MRADLFIVHRSDGLLRALVAMLVQEGYRVHSAESLPALEPRLGMASRPAVLLVDEDAAGPDWRERLERVPAEVPRVVLTWRPRASYPAGVTPLGKPFDARELLDTLSRNVARAGLRHPAAR